MVTIDPPYRFDVWENLVNVHWARGAEFLHQIFIFRRWSGPPYHGQDPEGGHGLTFSGDWYPISDQFALMAYNAGDIHLPFGPGIEISTGSELTNYMVWTEGRNKRSDLIKDGLAISLGITETDRTAWSGSFRFYYWDMNSVLLAEPQIQPSRENPPGWPVYYTVVGRYEEDDMTSGDWLDLANGVGAFDTTPIFVPP